MIKLSSVLEQLSRRNKQRERVSDFEYDESFNDTAEKKEFSTQFLQMQKNQLIQLKKQLKSYCHTLPVFGLNSAKCDINLFNRISCQFLLTTDKLNQQLSIKLVKLFLSSLVMCSYLTLWNFLVEPLVLTSFSKLTKQSKLTAFPLLVVWQSRKVEKRRTVSIRLLL